MYVKHVVRNNIYVGLYRLCGKIFLLPSTMKTPAFYNTWDIWKKSGDIYFQKNKMNSLLSGWLRPGTHFSNYKLIIMLNQQTCWKACCFCFLYYLARVIKNLSHYYVFFCILSSLISGTKHTITVFYFLASKCFFIVTHLNYILLNILTAFLHKLLLQYSLLKFFICFLLNCFKINNK